MPNILALDTSAGACSVALQFGATRYADVNVAERQHTQHVLPMVDKLLTEAGAVLTDLDAIAFGAGPGSFTGLRIACGVAQGLAFGAGLPLIPVSSLAAVALRGFIDTPEASFCLACFDARMNQVYAGFYANQTEPTLVGTLRVIEPELLQLPSTITDLIGVGSGMALASRFPASLQQVLTASNVSAEVLAADILSLAIEAFHRGETVAASDAEPLYLRQEINWKKTSEQ